MTYIGPEPNPGQNREVDDISSGFNGSEVNFTLQVNSQNISPGSSNSIIVSLGGVVQNPGTDYTVNASTLTFSTAPASGLSFFGLVLGQGVDAVEPADGSVSTVKIADQAVTLAKLPHGTGSNDGKFLRANNGADPSFETVTSTTINNNADNRVITGSGTANTLNGESNLIYDGNFLSVGGSFPASPHRIGIRDSSGNALSVGNSSASGNGSHDAQIVATEGTFFNNLKLSAHNIKFFANGSGGLLERARIDDEGLKFNGDTATANALNDYEEGNFSPTLPNGGGSVSFSVFTAKYIKIGDVVHIFCDIGSIANHQNLDLRIGGFPFTSSSVNATTATVLTGRADPGDGLTVNVFDSSAHADVRSQFSSDGQKGQIFNGHGLHFNLTYTTN